MISGVRLDLVHVLLFGELELILGRQQRSAFFSDKTLLCQQLVFLILSGLHSLLILSDLILKIDFLSIKLAIKLSLLF